MLSSLRLVYLVRSTACFYQAPSSARLLSSAAPATKAKSELGKLRKKTGYSLSICKKALSENDNDLVLAEKWLADQAQAQGWAKASKLQGRNTSQGLIGVTVRGNVASMVELNCETDFVARNEKFVSLLEEISNGCIKTEGGEGKTLLEKDFVANLHGGEGRSLADEIALNIGQIGENLALGRVTMMRAGEGVRLNGLSHPSVGSNTPDKLQSGRYGTLLAYRATKDDPVHGDQTASVLTRGICQHIIGMAPKYISDDEDLENSLVHQTYILDEDMKVGELLHEAGIELVDFVRAEVGRGEE